MPRIDEERKTHVEVRRERRLYFMRIKFVYGDEREPPVTLDVCTKPKRGEHVVVTGKGAAAVTKVVCTPGEAQDAVVALRKVTVPEESGG